MGPQSSSGESCEVHSEENKVTPEKNKKRKLKTPSQIEGLEKFYNEHKYPSEAMKAQLAEDLRLTEKQVSGWFCHRRLKDKRLLKEEACGNGKHDRSSVVIQDRGSGLRQDSCGSTKQGDHKLVDPREVESRRFCGQDFPTADLTSEYRNNNETFSAMDDTSSGSSSPLQDRFFPQSGDPRGMDNTRYLPHKGIAVPMNAKGLNNRGYGHGVPSGYLKVKGEVENASITAVKRQLGMEYRDDGPPLGVEFQSLPPGAFESPTKDIVSESYYVGGPIRPHSPNAPGARKQPVIDTGYEAYSSKLSSQDPYMENDDLRTVKVSDIRENYQHHRSKKKIPLPNHSNHFRSRNSSMDLNDDGVDEISGFNGGRNYGMRSKHDVDVMRLDSVSSHRVGQYGGKVGPEKTEPWLHTYDDVRPKNIPRREHFEPKSSSILVRHTESVDPDERVMLRRIKKEEMVYTERRAKKEYCEPVRVKMHPTSEMRKAKKVRDDYRQQDFLPKAKFVPQWTNQIKGSSGREMPSSFSEDETAETTSSMD